LDPNLARRGLTAIVYLFDDPEKGVLSSIVVLENSICSAASLAANTAEAWQVEKAKERRFSTDQHAIGS
jgi:hypothetical protein